MDINHLTAQDVDPDVLQRLKSELTEFGKSRRLQDEWAAGINCPKCEWDPKRSALDWDFAAWASAVIAYRKEQQNDDEKQRLGILIFECPKCFTKFWLHVRAKWIIHYVFGCKLWPEKDRELLKTLGLIK